MPGEPGSADPERLDPFASETRVRELVEQLPVVVYVDTDELRPSSLYISPNIEKILGRPVERFYDDPGLWVRSMHPGDRQRVRAIRDDAWTKGTPFRAEYRMLRPDGEEVWIRDSSVLVLSDAGNRLAWQGILEDLTKEKHSEQDLRDSEARYRALVERVPAVVYEMGPDDERRTLFVSPHVEEVLGYSRAEWLDQPDIWIELLHGDDREIVLAHHDQHSQTGEPWDLEYRLIANDGRVVWVHDRASLIRGDQDRPVTWHGVMIDVTAEHEVKEMLLLTKEDLERRVIERTAELEEANELMSLEIGERLRMQEEVREAEERYRFLVENMPGVAYVWEILPGAGPRSFGYVSPRIEDVLGFSPDEWRRSARVHPHDEARVAEAVERSARTGEPFRMECRYLAKEGGVVWVLEHATLISRTSDGRPFRFQGVMLDITARKDAESAAERAQDRFRMLTERGPAVMYASELRYEGEAWPPSVTFSYMSPRSADLMGYPVERWLDEPMSWMETVHPDDRERVRDEAERSWRTGEGWSIQYRMIRADGSLIWLHDTGCLTERDASGRPWRFQGVLLDTSDEQGSRLYLERVEREQRTALEGAKAVPWTETIDPETGFERYAYIGPQAFEILGYTPEELMVEPEHFPRMVHPDDRERVGRTTLRSNRTGIWEDEYRVIRRDGEIRWLHSFGRRVSPSGVVPEVWQGVAVDVTPARASTESTSDAARAGRTSSPEPNAG
jgi:PAS domain S-box-containing protein